MALESDVIAQCRERLWFLIGFLERNLYPDFENRANTLRLRTDVAVKMKSKVATSFCNEGHCSMFLGFNFVARTIYQLLIGSYCCSASKSPEIKYAIMQ